MKAILWDGQSQIKGELVLEKKRIKFKLLDFSETDLDFDLAYQEIKQISFYKLYDHFNAGLKIRSDKGKTNVFIVEETQRLKKAIDVRWKSEKEKKT